MADAKPIDIAPNGCPDGAGMTPTTLMAYSSAAIALAGVVSYHLAQKRRAKDIREWEGEAKDIPHQMTVQEWFMGKRSWRPSPQSFAIGMASGLVFGFIDNFGLFFGMSALDGLIKNKAPGGRYELLQAGWGNTFSDGVGAFLGTFGGKIITDLSYVEGWTTEEDENYPIVAEAIGIILGCMLGMLVPYMIRKSQGKTDLKGRICGLGEYKE